MHSEMRLDYSTMMASIGCLLDFFNLYIILMAWTSFNASKWKRF